MDPRNFIKNPINGLPDFDQCDIPHVMHLVSRIKHSQALDQFNLQRAKLSLAQRFGATLHPYVHPKQNTKSRRALIRAYVKKIQHHYLATNEDFIKKIDDEILRLRWRSTISAPTNQAQLSIGAAPQPF